MNIQLPGSWAKALEPELRSEYFKSLANFVDNAYRTETVYPPEKNIFEAFNRTPLEQVKVVIIGQDPYHNPNQAHGLCFSVLPDADIPPSLRNIYKELEMEYGTSFASRNGDLSSWADQGVLMLNATLTVSGGANTALSHYGRGWERFTDAAIRIVAENRDNVVYLLWGNSAQKKASFVDHSRNLLLSAAHPSPLSAYRGFFGCNHFKLCNEYLARNGLAPIQW